MGAAEDDTLAVTVCDGDGANVGWVGVAALGVHVAALVEEERVAVVLHDLTHVLQRHALHVHVLKALLNLQRTTVPSVFS